MIPRAAQALGAALGLPGQRHSLRQAAALARCRPAEHLTALLHSAQALARHLLRPRQEGTESAWALSERFQRGAESGRRDS